MSFSPQRQRRNLIFSEPKPRRALTHSLQQTAPTPHRTQLQELQRQLCSVWDRQAQRFLREIEENKSAILFLETKLRRNDEQITRKNFLIQSSRCPAGFVEQTIETEINKRLVIVTKKFAEMEDAFVANMFPKQTQSSQQQTIEVFAEPARNQGSGDNEYLKLKVYMDQRLSEMLAKANNAKGNTDKRCWEIGEQIRISEEVIETMSIGLSNIRSKLFSLDNNLKLIQSKAVQTRTVVDNLILGLKDELCRVNIEVENLRNRLTTPSARHVPVQTPMNSFRKSMHMQDVSEISSISSSLSFIPHPVFIPSKALQAPKQKSLARTKVTKVPPRTIRPMKPSNDSDEFLDLYRGDSSLDLTKQIMSPFQQAQYFNVIPELFDNSKSNVASTVPVRSLNSSIESRLRETVLRKRIPTPIHVQLDSSNYIKKENGAYLFDWNGEVLKASYPEFKRLCNLNILLQV